VAAPGRQGSQVISRSLRSWGRSTGANASAGAVKEPGHFEVRKSENTQARSLDALFPKKSWLFLVVALKTQAANAGNCSTVKLNQIKRSDVVAFLFSVHTPKHSNTQGGARAVDHPTTSFYLARPGVVPPLNILYCLPYCHRPMLYYCTFTCCTFYSHINRVTVDKLTGQNGGKFRWCIIV